MVTSILRFLYVSHGIIRLPFRTPIPPPLALMPAHEEQPFVPTMEFGLSEGVCLHALDLSQGLSFYGLMGPAWWKIELASVDLYLSSYACPLVS